jgi:hypothetical protein
MDHRLCGPARTRQCGIVASSAQLSANALAERLERTDSIRPDRPALPQRVQEHESAGNEEPRKIDVRRDVHDEEHRCHDDEADETSPERDDAILEWSVVVAVTHSESYHALLVMDAQHASRDRERSFGQRETSLGLVPVAQLFTTETRRRLDTAPDCAPVETIG